MTAPCPSTPLLLLPPSDEVPASSEEEAIGCHDDPAQPTAASHAHPRTSRRRITAASAAAGRSGRSARCCSALLVLHLAVVDLVLLFTTTLLLLPTPTSATRHNFVTKSDARHFIGPIGMPYGFTTHGHYNLTVYNFHLAVGHHNHGHKRGKDEDDEITRKVLDSVEAGFLLKRFKTESEFASYYETLLDDSYSSSTSDRDHLPVCAYEKFRTKKDAVGEETGDPLLTNDDEFAPIYSTENAAEDGIFLSMKNREKTWQPNTPSVEHTFDDEHEEGLYFLMYQLCPTGQPEGTGGADATRRHFSEIRSTFELDLQFRNYDDLGSASYLTAGEMYLPRVFLYFSVSYTICLVIWVRNIRSGGGGGGRGSGAGEGGGRPKVLPIHHMMSALLLLKTLSLYLESIRYHYIRVTGHAEFWSALYYTFAFLKGTFLFTVILLIGSGWSFVKPFLNEREKRVVALVLFLQVIDNVAVVVLNAETEGEKLYADWSAVLHLVDILCCCAVLVPIVWSVNALEQSVEQRDAGDNGGKGGGANGVSGAEGAEVAPLTAAPGGEGGSSSSIGGGGGSEDAKTLTKLKLFRSFYLLVVAYVYFTRIIVYLFATLLDYRHTWLRYFVLELGTLVFYTVVGIKFRPMVENPYFAVKKDDYYDEDVSNGGGGSGRTVEMGRFGGDKA